MRLAAALLVMSSICLAQGQTPTQLFDDALAAQRRGDLNAAIESYEHALKIEPGLTAARVNLAGALVQAGKLDQAAEEYRLALRQHPGNFPIVRLLGNCLVIKGDSEGAIRLLRPVARNHPQDLDVAFLLGEALIHARRPREALKLIKKVAAGRNDANAWMLAGITELQLGDYRPAAEDLENGLRLDPTVPGAYTMAGIARAGVGEENAAKDAFRKALEADANDFQANLRLGTILRREGSLDQARPYLERALGINPSDLFLRYQLAQLEAAGGHDAAAVADLEFIIQAAPNILEPHVQLSGLYYRMHRAEDGLRERKIVDNLLNHPELQDHRLEQDPSLGADKPTGQSPSP